MQPQRSRSRRHKSGQPYLQGSKTHVTAICVSFCQPERPTRCAPPELQEHRLALSPPDTRAFQSRMARCQRTSGRRHAPVKSEAVLLPAVAGKKIPLAAARPFALRGRPRRGNCRAPLRPLAGLPRDDSLLLDLRAAPLRSGAAGRCLRLAGPHRLRCPCGLRPSRTRSPCTTITPRETAPARYNDTALSALLDLRSNSSLRPHLDHE